MCVLGTAGMNPMLDFGGGDVTSELFFTRNYKWHTVFYSSAVVRWLEEGVDIQSAPIHVRSNTSWQRCEEKQSNLTTCTFSSRDDFCIRRVYALGGNDGKKQRG
jgi:hypothetical protein